MDGVKHHFLADDLNLQVEVVKRLGHCFQLAHGVVGESPPLAPVVELEAVRRLIVAKIRGSLDPVKTLSFYRGGVVLLD